MSFVAHIAARIAEHQADPLRVRLPSARGQEVRPLDRGRGPVARDLQADRLAGSAVDPPDARDRRDLDPLVEQRGSRISDPWDRGIPRQP